MVFREQVASVHKSRLLRSAAAIPPQETLYCYLKRPIGPNGQSQSSLSARSSGRQPWIPPCDCRSQWSPPLYPPLPRARSPFTSVEGHKAQSQQYLTPFEEKAIVEFTIQMAELGNPIRIKYIPSIAFSATRHGPGADRLFNRGRPCALKAAYRDAVEHL